MKTKVGIIGGGNMGSAIVAGINGRYSVSVCEKDKKRSQSLKRRYKVSIRDLKAVVNKSQVIILAVKPQNFANVLKEIRSIIKKDQLIISIAAGITCQYIEKRLDTKIHVVRTMPNLPAQVGQGITAMCAGKNTVSKDLKIACQIFTCIGEVIVVEEKWMNAITAISGSGPAYVFLFIECLQKSAASLGLKKEISRELILQTLKGSLELFEKQKEGASVLRSRVTSKGGTTQAAMDVFQKNKIDKVFEKAISSAYKRAKDLSI